MVKKTLSKEKKKNKRKSKEVKKKIIDESTTPLVEKLDSQDRQ